MNFTCTCGTTSTDVMPMSAADHCPVCGTRPSPELGVTVTSEVPLANGRTATWTTTGHRYWDAGVDSDGDPILRCMDCDGRPHSHRRYPGDYGYESLAALAGVPA